MHIKEVVGTNRNMMADIGLAEVNNALRRSSFINYRRHQAPGMAGRAAHLQEPDVFVVTENIHVVWCAVLPARTALYRGHQSLNQPFFHHVCWGLPRQGLAQDFRLSKSSRSRVLMKS